MNEVKVVQKIKLPRKVQLEILKESVKKGSEKALKDPVEWAVALTSGVVTGVKDEDRNKGITIAALLMAKGIVVKSVEEAVEMHAETKELFEKILKEEK